MADDSAANAATTVDFTATGTATPLTFEKRLRAGGITLVRCRTRLNPTGGEIVSPQTTIVVPAGPAFDLDWRPPDGDRVCSTTIGRGRVMIYAAGVSVWKRWQGMPAIFVMALSADFVAAIRQQGFEPANGSALPTIVGVDDHVVEDFMRLAERELDAGGLRGPLFVEGVATALTAHMLQTYGGNWQVERKNGALAPQDLRRVTDYVASHLAEDLPLAELARIGGLSPHHFGQAFKAATGLTPHQYVIRQRIERACDLLRDPNLTLAQIAIAVGFSHQSHLTEHFRRVTGSTPARFRRSLT